MRTYTRSRRWRSASPEGHPPALDSVTSLTLPLRGRIVPPQPLLHEWQEVAVNLGVQLAVQLLLLVGRVVSPADRVALLAVPDQVEPVVGADRPRAPGSHGGLGRESPNQ